MRVMTIVRPDNYDLMSFPSLQTLTNNPAQCAPPEVVHFKKEHLYEIGRKSSLLKKSSSVLVTLSY